MTSHEWGRVADDGTVFVKTADGERSPQPRPGMSAVVELRVRSAESAVSVPSAAVVRDGERDAVFVEADGAYRRREVRLGAEGEDVVQVSSAQATAAELFRELTDDGTLRDPGRGEPEHQFLTTGDPHEFTPLARRFLGPEVEHVGRAYVGRPEEQVARVGQRAGSAG